MNINIPHPACPVCNPKCPCCGTPIRTAPVPTVNPEPFAPYIPTPVTYPVYPWAPSPYGVHPYPYEWTTTTFTPDLTQYTAWNTTGAVS